MGPLAEARLPPGSADSERPGEARQARRVVHYPVAARRLFHVSTCQVNDLTIPSGAQGSEPRVEDLEGIGGPAVQVREAGLVQD